MPSGSGRSQRASNNDDSDETKSDSTGVAVGGSPVVDPDVAQARAEATPKGPKRLQVTLAHALFQDTDTGRCVGVESARDPRTNEVPDGWVYRAPGEEITVTVDQATTLISAAYVQIDPYDTVAVDVLLSSAK